MKLSFRDAFPAEYKPFIRATFQKYKHIIPGWCNDIYVRYSKEKDVSGECLALPEYRYAKIWIATGYPPLTDYDRERTLVHELVHIPLWPMHERGVEMIEMLYEETDEAGKADALRQWDKLTEGATEDLTQAFLKVGR